MDNRNYKHRLAALLSADVVGYSRLMVEDELGTIRTLTAYRAEMTALARSRGGRVVNFVGDNMLAEFTSALDIELANFAMRLTPVYPVYYPAVLAAAYYGCRRYEDAMAAARKVLQSERDNLDALLILAGANAALDRTDAARQASNEVLRDSPDFRLDKYAATQPYSDPQDLAQVIEMLQKAGLE